MRKIIKVLSALLFSTITTGSIIACANPFVDPNVFRVTIVTDGHTITDKSFNESAYNGAVKFKSDFEQWSSTSAPAEFKNKKIAITAIQPPTTELSAFLQGYGQSVVMDSKVTVAAGFIQNSALISAQNGFLRHKMRYIYIDGDTPEKDVPSENKNLAGLLYKAEQSGLMAALAAAVWLVANSDQYDINNLKMTSYGGINIPAVTSYMYGFYWGIDLINNSETYSSVLNTELKNAVKILNPDFDITKPLPKISFVNLPNQFTGNFDQASISSKALNDSLVNQGSNIIFPVAGPQTSDTLSAIQSKRTRGKVIGVDTDQQLQYKESANYFLTSALKNIVGSVNKTLWQAFGLDPETHQTLNPEQMDQIFKKDAVPQGGAEFTGIANNPAISPIYNNIVNSPELTKTGGFLDKVSQGWQQVLTSNKDFWDYGKTLNPFTLPGLERINNDSKEKY